MIEDKNRQTFTKLNHHVNQMIGCIKEWRAKDEISIGIKKELVDQLKRVCRLTAALTGWYEKYEEAKNL